MAGRVPGDPSYNAVAVDRSNTTSDIGHGDSGAIGSSWYFSRKEIEENSPSRKDGIDLKKETYLRKSYCAFLQDLGMRLKVPQVTIATAIVFCHRFFLRQSHLKNDRRTVATVCMFLAGKIEETPRPMRDIIVVSYEIVHKKDSVAVQKIKQREVYEQQKELILLGERVVLATLGFDFTINHPYKPLVEAIKKFKVAQNALAQVAWNFVNDGLRTSLCLQFLPHHIAAGAIFLAAKFLKVKLPHDGDKVWWQEFDVTPRQLEEVSNQMLELYEQNRVPQPLLQASQQMLANETESTSASMEYHHISSKPPALAGSPAQASKHSAPAEVPRKHGAEKMHTSANITDERNKSRSSTPSKKHVDVKDNQHQDPRNLNNKSIGAQEHAVEVKKSSLAFEISDVRSGRSDDSTNGPKIVTSPMIDDAMNSRMRTAQDKLRKTTADTSLNADVLDEDSTIEIDLENGAGKLREVKFSMHNQEHQSPNNSHKRKASSPNSPFSAKQARGL